MWSPIQQTPTCVVILFSIHFVLKAEKFLKRNGISHDVIPVPREISSDCGMAVEFSCLEKERVLELLASADLRIAGLYRRDGKNSFKPISAEQITANVVN
ncbi:MAG: DUF3343 domain-containing protein [Proteobacteria bacterium]|nr:DUF3343 domain-containing protein [Pseudomonadota bacterium]MBU0964849.1 DUF3343 domain-containing protein [Pseudomonadota bacterium]